jgi:predicted transcriptional regulator
MNTNVLSNRKRATFRLSEHLLDRLTAEAKKENTSLNNYVESALMDSVTWKPNRETLEAMKEAEEGINLTEVDMTSLENFIKSLE